MADKFSYSRVSTFKNCQYQYFLRYIKKLKTIQVNESDNALVLGSTIHLAIEKGIEEARKFYFSQFNILTDEQVNEFMKIELLLPRITQLLPTGECEVHIESNDFMGFIDRLVPVDNNTFDIYDYKYTNNIENYLQSAQLHLYKYYFELMHPEYKINNLYFVFIPKTGIRQKKTEDLFMFRKRIKEELDKKDIVIKQVDYDIEKVNKFFANIEEINNCKEFNKNITRLCDFCEYKDYCQSNGKIDYNIINK